MFQALKPLRRLWWKVNPHYLRACTRAERLWHYVAATPTKWGRRPWPRTSETRERRNVGVVIANYNTKDYAAHLIYSLYQTLDMDRVARIVVVDNASTDGSCALLSALAKAGLIDLIANTRQRYHGPGVNQGIEHLRRLADDGAPIDYVWVLDSDTVVVDGGVLDAALDAMRRTRAGVAGEYLDGVPSLPDGYAHICSLLIDPQLVWQPGVEPMHESGTPAEAMQISCERRGIPRIDFGFMRDGYVIHLGSGTLAQIRRADDRRNRYRDWACRLEDRYRFHDNPGAAAVYRRLVEEFRATVPVLEGDRLVAACAGATAKFGPRPTLVGRTP